MTAADPPPAASVAGLLRVVNTELVARLASVEAIMVARLASVEACATQPVVRGRRQHARVHIAVKRGGGIEAV